MTRVLFVLVAAVGLSAVAEAKTHPYADRATIEALAGTYSFQETAAPDQGCQITFKRDAALRRDGQVLRPLELTSTCFAKFSPLRSITHWVATGGASIALFGGDPLTEMSDFSPVQDGTGVYLRGGFPGDAKIYELRALPE